MTPSSKRHLVRKGGERNRTSLRKLLNPRPLLSLLLLWPPPPHLLYLFLLLLLLPLLRRLLLLPLSVLLMQTALTPNNTSLTILAIPRACLEMPSLPPLHLCPLLLITLPLLLLCLPHLFSLLQLALTIVDTQGPLLPFPLALLLLTRVRTKKSRRNKCKRPQAQLRHRVVYRYSLLR